MIDSVISQIHGIAEERASEVMMEEEYKVGKKTNIYPFVIILIFIIGLLILIMIVRNYRKKK